MGLIACSCFFTAKLRNLPKIHLGIYSNGYNTLPYLQTLISYLCLLHCEVSQCKSFHSPFVCSFIARLRTPTLYTLHFLTFRILFAKAGI